jgi:hypothetical protein
MLTWNSDGTAVCEFPLKQKCSFQVPPSRLLNDVLRVGVVTKDRLTQDRPDLAEGFLPLSGFVGDGNFAFINSTQWCQLYGKDPLARKGSTGKFKRKVSRGSVGSSGRKDSGGGADGAAADDVAPLLAWLNDVAACATLGTATASGLVAATKGKQWADLVPAIGMSGQPAEAVHKAQALWELYSSEACHLDTLEVLCHPFLAVLQQVQATATSDLRNRAPFLAAVNLHRLFSCVDTLRQASTRFMRRLAASMRIPDQSGGNDSRMFGIDGDSADEHTTSDATIYAMATQTSAIVEAVEALKGELLPAEMEYRLRQKASRVYLKNLTESEDPHFQTYLKWCESDSRCGRMSLSDLLVQPLQRLTRYPLLLRSIIKGANGPEEASNLTACLESLEKAIDAHNRVIEEHESTAHLGRVEEQLIWPSLLERQPKDYVPDALRKQFSLRPEVSLKDELHDLDTMAVRRGFTYEGMLHMLGKRGLPYQSVFAYLFGDVFLLASSNQGSGTNTSKSGTGKDSKNGKKSRLVEGQVHHISKIQVIDIPEQSQSKNCFVMLFMDGFNNAYEFKTFQVASRYEKADWMRHLQSRIDLCSDPNRTTHGNGVQRSSSGRSTGSGRVSPGGSVGDSSRERDARRTRMAPSRAPLGGNASLRKTNSARDLGSALAASTEPEGFWGLDHLSSNADAPVTLQPIRTIQKQQARARQLPTPISRTRSLPKTPADSFEWDDFCAATPALVEATDYQSAWSAAPGVPVRVTNPPIKRTGSLQTLHRHGSGKHLPTPPPLSTGPNRTSSFGAMSNRGQYADDVDSTTISYRGMPTSTDETLGFNDHHLMASDTFDEPDDAISLGSLSLMSHSSLSSLDRPRVNIHAAADRAPFSAPMSWQTLAAAASATKNADSTQTNTFVEHVTYERSVEVRSDGSGGTTMVETHKSSSSRSLAAQATVIATAQPPTTPPTAASPRTLPGDGNAIEYKTGGRRYSSGPATSPSPRPPAASHRTPRPTSTRQYARSLSPRTDIVPYNNAIVNSTSSPVPPPPRERGDDLFPNADAFAEKLLAVEDIDFTISSIPPADPPTKSTFALPDHTTVHPAPRPPKQNKKGFTYVIV